MPVTFRSICTADVPLLREFLYLAVHVPPGRPPYPRDILDLPDIARYAAGWGRADDAGFFACIDDRPVGAAWIRMLVGGNRGFGYVDEHTPELAMSVLPELRGQGIGGRLLGMVLDEASRMHPGVCLSVDEDNRARELYLRTGFVPVGMVGNSVTMVLRFSARQGR